jgi:hypothetical protein
MDCVLQVEFFHERREVIGVGVHAVTIVRLGRSGHGHGGHGRYSVTVWEENFEKREILFSFWIF